VDSIKILDNGNGDEDKGLEVSAAEGRIRILFLPDGTSDNASTLTGSTVIAAATTVTAIMVGSRGRMIAIYLFYEILLNNVGTDGDSQRMASSRFLSASQKNGWSNDESH